MVDEGRVRIGDAERRLVVDLLSQQTSEGRLTLDEFAERAGHVYEARTRHDLDRVVDDIPVDLSASLASGLPVPTEQAHAPVARQSDPGRKPRGRRRFIAIMSGASARGRWWAPRRMLAVAFCGGVTIDLREAVIDSPVVDIDAWAIMGGVDIVVPEGIPVELDGFVLMGGSDNRTRGSDHLPGAPLVRVHARGLWGGVGVRTRRQRDLRRMAKEAHQPLDGAIAGGAPQRERGDRQRGTLTMLVTDIVASSRLAEQLGDQRWLDVLRTHNGLVRKEISSRGGTEVKLIGDGFLVVFPSARQAILAAVAIQQAMTVHQQEWPGHPMELRIGLHTGEVVEDDDDIHGQNVVVAVRIASAAAPGEILVSGVTRDLTASAGDLSFEKGRDITLKGFAEPRRVHSVCWD